MRICPGLIKFSTSSNTFRIVEMPLADIASQPRVRTCPYVPVHEGLCVTRRLVVSRGDIVQLARIIPRSEIRSN